MLINVLFAENTEAVRQAISAKGGAALEEFLHRYAAQDLLQEVETRKHQQYSFQGGSEEGRSVGKELRRSII